jgi:hypothetical protein
MYNIIGVITIKTSIYDELAYYIIIGDYSPIIAIVASVLIIFIVYLFILRPIINHLVLINVSDQLFQNKNIVIKDRKYKIQEIKNMREELLRSESKILEDKLYSEINNFIDWLIKIGHIILTSMNKILEGMKFRKKARKSQVDNSIKGDNYEEV